MLGAAACRRALEEIYFCLDGPSVSIKGLESSSGQLTASPLPQPKSGRVWEQRCCKRGKVPSGPHTSSSLYDSLELGTGLMQEEWRLLRSSWASEGGCSQLPVCLCEAWSPSSRVSKDMGQHCEDLDWSQGTRGRGARVPQPTLPARPSGIPEWAASVFSFTNETGGMRGRHGVYLQGSWSESEVGVGDGQGGEFGQNHRLPMSLAAVLLPAQGRTLSPQQSTLASCCSSSLQAMLGWMRFTARALFSA